MSKVVKILSFVVVTRARAAYKASLEEKETEEMSGKREKIRKKGGEERSKEKCITE